MRPYPASPASPVSPRHPRQPLVPLTMPLTRVMGPARFPDDGDGDGDGDGGNGGGGGGGGNGGGSGNGGGGGGRPKSFTQDELNAIVARRLADDRRSRNFNPADREELERLRQADRDRATTEAESKQQYEAAKASLLADHKTKLESAQSAIAGLRDQLYNVTVTREIEVAASGLAADPSDISALLRHRVKFNENNQPVVYDEHGNPAYVSGQPMTISQMVTAFLAQPTKAHLRKPTQRKPAGANDGDSGADDKPGDGDQLPAAITKLKKAADDAEAKAKATGQPVDISAAMTASRKLNEAMADHQKQARQ